MQQFQKKTTTLNKIKPGPQQVRREFEPEAMREMVRTIRESGLLTPPIVYAWNERADAFILQCREQGVTWKGIARMMAMKPAKIQNRYEWLKKQDGQSVLCVPEGR